MKSITLDTGFLYYQKIFKLLVSKADPIILWQLDASAGKRSIKQSLLTSFNLEQDQLFFSKSAEYSFNIHEPLYGFVQEGAFIFKLQLKSQQEKSLSAYLPKELKFLEGRDYDNFIKATGIETDKWISIRENPYNEDFGIDYVRVKSMKNRSAKDQDFLSEEMGLSLDDEDKLFADKRESPRARPKVDKYVTLSIMGSDEVETFKLFDLSRGGLAFIVSEEGAYKKGEGIRISGFNEYSLDDPLYGTVMSIREIDETSQFKVGIKFLED